MKRKVLLVHNGEDFVKQAKIALNDAYEVCVVGTTREGRRQAGTEDFSVILLGLFPPWSEALRLYRELQDNPKTEHTPVLLVDGPTGLRAKPETKGKMANTEGYISQPVAPEKLREAVDRVLVGWRPMELRSAVEQMEQSLKQIEQIRQILDTGTS